MTKTTNAKPSHYAYSVKDNGNSAKGYWTKIGVAFAHNDGQGFNLILEALPLDGRLTLRKPDPKAEDGAPG